MAHAPSFAVTEPSAEETPVIVEVPHAGLFLDGEALASLAAPARSIGRDADLWVDELYSAAPAEGATLLVSRVSRYLERDLAHPRLGQLKAWFDRHMPAPNRERPA